MWVNKLWLVLKFYLLTIRLQIMYIWYMFQSTEFGIKKPEGLIWHKTQPTINIEYKYSIPYYCVQIICIKHNHVKI